MPLEGRRHPRVPARVEVALETRQGRSVGVSSNLSLGGVAVRVAEGDAASLVTGTACVAAVTLATGVLEGPAHIVWSTQRLVRGQTHREVGVQFDEGVALDALEHFLDGFRFEVATLGFAPSEAFLAQVAAYARVTRVSTIEALVAAAAMPEVGALLCHANAATVREAVVAAEPRGLPVIAVVTSMDAALTDVLARVPRLFCQVEPVDPTALASLTVRVLEATTQSEESDRLTVTLEREVNALRQENSTWRERLRVAPRIEGLLGTSAAMQQVADDIDRLAGLDTTVLLVGETGTGKGVAARAVHRASRRAKKPLISQNCAALPEALLDSELFGHVRGAFTGAIADRPGIFEAAHEGTIFLDELTEMSPAMQAKLLTVLQDGEFRRVGSTETTRVDVRVLCATNQPLEPLVERGQFREDLYYRLAPFIVRLPPLRARRDDIATLAVHTLAQFQARYTGPERTIELEAMTLLEQAPWPGNVRQLQHAVERLAIGAAGNGVITAAMVREALALPTPRGASARVEVSATPTLAAGESLTDAVERYERELIRAALERAHFVISDAAAALHVNRSTLSRRLRQLGIRLPGRA